MVTKFVTNWTDELLHFFYIKISINTILYYSMEMYPTFVICVDLFGAFLKYEMYSIQATTCDAHSLTHIQTIWKLSYRERDQEVEDEEKIQHSYGDCQYIHEFEVKIFKTSSCWCISVSSFFPSFNYMNDVSECRRTICRCPESVYTVYTLLYAHWRSRFVVLIIPFVLYNANRCYKFAFLSVCVCVCVDCTQNPNKLLIHVINEGWVNEQARKLYVDQILTCIQFFF